MIEVGEYVRTKQGEIAKIVDTNMFDKTIYKDIQGVKYYLEDIKKHSINIIDLIEIGDLVRIFVEENVDENGTTEDTCVYEVTATQVKDFYGNKLEEIGIVGEDGVELIPFANVRGIVTKEQFASMEYRVKEGL